MIINQHALYLSSQLNNYYLYLNRINYASCISEMNRYFAINRIKDQIKGDNDIFNIYKSSSYRHSLSFSSYILQRFKRFGENTVPDYLKHHNLKSIMSLHMNDNIST
jgi:hypothetical protein|uniref:Uncharacterized protein n=1 Tax=viral metagenome TaxID=1070528 RepID=A0A6C0ISR0_9ZZZZ